MINNSKLQTIRSVAARCTLVGLCLRLQPPPCHFLSVGYEIMMISSGVHQNSLERWWCYWASATGLAKGNNYDKCGGFGEGSRMQANVSQAINNKVGTKQHRVKCLMTLMTNNWFLSGCRMRWDAARCKVDLLIRVNCSMVSSQSIILSLSITAPHWRRQRRGGVDDDGLH